MGSGASMAQSPAEKAFRDLDEPLRQALECGWIRLVSADIIRSGELDRMQRRQDLEALHSRNGGRVYVDCREAAKILRSGVRAIGFLSYMWRTFAHPDPDGETMKAVVRWLKVRSDLKAIFVDFMSLFQRPRSAEQNALFGKALPMMAYGYASPLGTSVGRFEKMPPCPSGKDRDVVIVDAAKADRKSVEGALGGAQGCRGLDWLEESQSWVAHMATAQKANDVVQRFERGAGGGLPVGARVFPWYNSRGYWERGWCTLEAAVSGEFVAQAQFRTELMNQIRGLPPKVVSIGGSQIVADPVPDGSEGAGPRIERIRSALQDEKQTKFTGRGDRGKVVQMFSDFITKFFNVMSKVSPGGIESVYEGERRHGRKHGKGAERYANGDRYEGEFREDEMHGAGTYHYADGDRYEGEFREDKRHGVGTFHYAFGARYVGEWREDKKHGAGTFHFADGGRYEGEWRESKMHGAGTYHYASGNRYVGEFREDNRHGTGTYYHADGDRYEGEFREGQMHGACTEHFACGDRRDGVWKEGRLHGKATFHRASGARREEVWRDGELQA